MGNVLNALPKSQPGRVKTDLQAIWMARDACRHVRRVRSIRNGLCGETSEGDRNAE
jgi:hypothetical protein